MSELIPQDVLGLSKIANNLIDKISSAIGWVTTHDTPNRIAIKLYIEDIEESNLPPLQKAVLISRAKKDIKEYANQQMIVQDAFKYLIESAEPQKIEDDWIAHFFDKTRLVSDEEFQTIWSRLLAEECNNPGSVPKSLMFILERMSREDAEDFVKLCAITITAFKESAPLIINFEIEALKEFGLNFDKLIQLESLGLIKMSEGILDSGFALGQYDVSQGKTIVKYFDDECELPDNMYSFPVGRVLFTKDGYALYKAASAEKLEGFWEDKVLPWINMQIDFYKKNLTTLSEKKNNSL